MVLVGMSALVTLCSLLRTRARTDTLGQDEEDQTRARRESEKEASSILVNNRLR